VRSHWATYIGEEGRRENFGAKMWDECGVLWGTHWEIEKHHWEHAATRWEQDEDTKIKKIHPRTPAPLPLLCPQGKKDDPSRVHVQPSRWLHAISIPKTGCHHTWPELILLFKRVGSRYAYIFTLIN
jgi:hypothetical protein